MPISNKRKKDKIDTDRNKLYILYGVRVNPFILTLSMASQRAKVLDLYKNLLYMGRDYPLGYDFFRAKCRNAFLKNRHETNPVKIKQMIAYGKYTLKELEAMYKLRKYRALKQRYYAENEGTSETEKVLNKD